jgi:dTDP-4-dehydrorhamnose reductase
MDILVTGGAGQVGLEVARLPRRSDVIYHMPTRQELDLADPRAFAAFFENRIFDAVINTAAYTAVDKAENDVAGAYAANALAPALLADLARARNMPLIQISTDYVFDGTAQRPYEADDAVNPLGVYGASKLAGEMAVLRGASRSLVLRTAWVVSAQRANFAKTMLRLAAQQPRLRVVDDQHGAPTSAADLAAALELIAVRMIQDAHAPAGVYHFSNAGQTTWCGLARRIFEVSGALGGAAAEVEGIATAEYPTPARRPAFSVLSTSKITRDYGISPRPWRDAVDDIVQELTDGTAK